MFILSYSHGNLVSYQVDLYAAVDSSKVGILVAVIVGVGMIFLIISISLWFRLRKRSKAHKEGDHLIYILVHYIELAGSV